MQSPFSKALEEFLETRTPRSSQIASWKDLEEDYTSALKKEDLERLGLPKYLAPDIGRGLPKRYSQTNPAHCQVKQSFSDVALLRRLRIEKAIFFLYQQQNALKGAKIAILTWVIADGMGDYFAQQEAATTLSEKFPALYLISLLHKDSAMPLSSSLCPHYFLRYSGKLNHPIIHEAFSDHLLNKLSRTDLILEFPTAFPYMASLLDSLKKCNPTLKYLRIGEQSLIESLDFKPSTDARCMGLHTLEMGVFSKKNSFRGTSILALQYQPLLKILLSSNTESSVENYLQSHSFNTAYTKTFRGTYLYLYMLCKGLREHPKDLDVCFFNLNLMLKVLKERLNTSTWNAWNIGKVVIYTQKQIIPICISKAPKILRLIHCPPLVQQDLHTLFCFTQHLIGCTGDQTLCEAICTGVPFYYDPPPFKRAVLKDLLHLASSRLSHYPCLESLFKLLLRNPFVFDETAEGEWVSEDYIQSENDRLTLEEDSDDKIGDALASLLNEPQFSKGFHNLRDIIHHEYAFEPLLTGIVNRILFHHRFPSLMHWEQDAMAQFANQGSSAYKFLEDLKHKIYTFN